MENEFVALCDMALAKGVKHSDLIGKISAAVYAEYRKRYASSPQNVQVLVDTTTGEVRLIADRTDVTPPEFAPVASSIGRQIVIREIRQTEGSSGQKTHSLSKWFVSIVFWGYNLLYILFLSIFVLVFIDKTFRDQYIQTFTSLGLYRQLLFCLLILTPLSTIVLTVKEKFYADSTKLLKLFFLVELPVVTITFFTFSMVSNPVPIVWFFTLTLIFAPIVLFLHTLPVSVSSTRVQTALLFIHQTLAMSSLYLSVLFAFFVPLVIGFIAKFIFRDVLSSFLSYGIHFSSPLDILPLFFGMVFGALFLLGIAFALIFPFMATMFLLRLFRESRSALVKYWGTEGVNIATIGFAFFLVSAVFFLSYQPSKQTYVDDLEKYGLATTFEEKEQIARKLLPHEGEVKTALTTITNYHTRYLFSKNDDFVAQMYRDVFNMNKTLANALQRTFLIYAYPFVYQGATDVQGTLGVNFESIFGTSPWGNYYQFSGGTAPATVNMVSQKISAIKAADSLLATVTTEEEYSGSSWQSEEVIYEFSLPSDAVVTGLKLGPSLEFDGVIAPRGAAQITYEQELNRRRDPALLEQTGPRQYRLRVFPIPGKNDSSTLGGKHQKVQFTYVVGVQPEGIPLPVYAAKRNLLSSVSPEVLLNENATRYKDGDLFIRLTGTNQSTINLCDAFPPLHLSLGANSSPTYELLANYDNPLFASDFRCDRAGHPQLNARIQNTKIALLLDVSLSDKGNTIVKELQQISKTNPTFFADNTVNMYLFNEELSLPHHLDQAYLSKTSSMIFFGKSNLTQALRSLAKQGSYDLIVIATGKEPLPEDLAVTTLSDIRAPIALIHADGIIPAYNSDLAVKLLSGKGWVADTFTDAVNHHANTNSASAREIGSSYLFVGPYWSIRSSKPLGFLPEHISSDTFFGDFSPADSSPFTSLVGKTYLFYRLSAFGTIGTQTPIVDAANAFAQKIHFITPYSSLIALVNQQQRDTLDRESGQIGRYNERPLTPNRDINIPPPVGFRIQNMGAVFSPGLLGGAMMEGGGSSFSIPRPYDDGPVGKFGPMGRIQNPTFGPAIGGIFGLFLLATGTLVGGAVFVFIFMSLKKVLQKKKFRT